jgi:MFS family permease
MGRVAARHRSLSESQQRWLTLLAMCAATFMISLDVTIVNVALPVMQRELHMPPGDLEWVISAYSLSLAGRPGTSATTRGTPPPPASGTADAGPGTGRRGRRAAPCPAPPTTPRSTVEVLTSWA